MRVGETTATERRIDRDYEEDREEGIDQDDEEDYEQDCREDSNKITKKRPTKITKKESTKTTKKITNKTADEIQLPAEGRRKYCYWSKPSSHSLRRDTDAIRTAIPYSPYPTIR